MLLLTEKVLQHVEYVISFHLLKTLQFKRTKKFDVYVSIVRNNDITGSNDHDFCVDHVVYGKRVVYDLKPGGRNIPVTEVNKKEYVRYVFFKLITRQLLACSSLQNSALLLQNVGKFNKFHCKPNMPNLKLPNFI